MSKRKVVQKIDMAARLADWFWGHRDATLIPDAAVKEEVHRLERGAGPRYTEQRKHHIISDVRRVMRELRPGRTVVRVRGIGFKVSDDVEYAGYTVGHLRRAVAYADLVIQLAPHAKREALTSELYRQIGNNEKELRKLANVRTALTLEVHKWRRGITDESAKKG